MGKRWLTGSLTFPFDLRTQSGAQAGSKRKREKGIKKGGGESKVSDLVFFCIGCSLTCTIAVYCTLFHGVVYCLQSDNSAAGKRKTGKKGGKKAKGTTVSAAGGKEESSESEDESEDGDEEPRKKKRAKAS